MVHIYLFLKLIYKIPNNSLFVELEVEILNTNQSLITPYINVIITINIINTFNYHVLVRLNNFSFKTRLSNHTLNKLSYYIIIYTKWVTHNKRFEEWKTRTSPRLLFELSGVPSHTSLLHRIRRKKTSIVF